MLKSHELPLQILNKDTEYNDYSFVLPTYWYKSEEYKQHYLNQKQQGRFLIADCGLFEGDYFSPEDLFDFINELQPNYFVIPDVWNDAEQSLKNAKDWIEMIKFKNTKYLAVVQCTDLKIGTKLYKEYCNIGVDGIAFNHSSIAYQDMFPHANLSVSKMMGRIYFINHLIKNNIIDITKYHHLLGASIWTELMYYKEPEYSFINSVDTSSPIVWGCKGTGICTPEAMQQKPPEKIEEWFDKILTEKQLEQIQFNVENFKRYV